MTTITITPEQAEAGVTIWCAASRGLKSLGRTAGEALDKLASQLDGETSGAMVLIQPMRPDRFFTAAQQQRLEDLIGRWRAARDSSRQFPAADQAELEALVEAQLEGAAKRAESMLADIKP